MKSEYSRIRIVIADDSEIIRERLSLFLEENEKFEIAGKATNGSEAIKMVSSLAPDILILDYNMPGLDGVQVAKSLRLLQSAVKIIMFTAHTGKNFEDLFFRAGVDHVFDKGSDFNELPAILDSMIKNPK